MSEYISKSTHSLIDYSLYVIFCLYYECDWWPWMSEECVRFPGTRIADGCEPPSVLNHPAMSSTCRVTIVNQEEGDSGIAKMLLK